MLPLPFIFSLPPLYVCVPILKQLPTESFLPLTQLTLSRLAPIFAFPFLPSPTAPRILSTVTVAIPIIPAPASISQPILG